VATTTCGAVERPRAGSPERSRRVHPEGTEGCILREPKGSSKGLAVTVRALLGRLGQNFHFLLQATAQLIFLDLKIMVRLEV